MSYSQLVRNISPATDTALGAVEVLGAAGGAMVAVAKNDAVAKQAEADRMGRFFESFGVGIAGGVLGAFLWKKHRVLGFMGGHSLAYNATEVYLGGAKSDALYSVGVGGLSIASSLHFKRHPFWGYVGANVLAESTLAFVPGTPANKALAKFKRTK